MSDKMNDKSKRGKMWYDGRTLWAERTAQDSVSLGLRPDRMEVPQQVCDIDGGPRTRKVVRQYESACPQTGELVTTRELEGPVYCWINPRLKQGFQFGFKPTLTAAAATVIDGDCGN